jgi:hypothetical protein
MRHAFPHDITLMNISSATSSIAKVDFANQVSVAVAKKALDQAKSQGEAAVQLIKDAGKLGHSVRTASGGIDALA